MSQTAAKDEQGVAWHPCQVWTGIEWRAIKGTRAMQPYAIAMKDGSPFGLAGIWENWRNPTTEEWERTFAIITVPSNELVRQIHDRMPAILRPESFDHWLGVEPDPHDLLITYPSEPVTMWPIFTRVNAPENKIAGSAILRHQTHVRSHSHLLVISRTDCERD
jgi:putative SOS response-associated peptidase YedK